MFECESGRKHFAICALPQQCTMCVCVFVWLWLWKNKQYPATCVVCDMCEKLAIARSPTALSSAWLHWYVQIHMHSPTIRNTNYSIIKFPSTTCLMAKNVSGDNILKYDDTICSTLYVCVLCWLSWFRFFSFAMNGMIAHVKRQSLSHFVCACLFVCC